MSDVAFQSLLTSRSAEPSARYRRWFGIAEIEDSLTLKWFAGALLLGFFVTFNSWIGNTRATAAAVDTGTNVCWPVFQNCSWLIMLDTLPAGYSQMAVFMGLFGVMLMAVWKMHRGDWVTVHALMAFLFVAKAYFTAINFNHKGNFDYYHTTFCVIWLVVPHRVFFLRFSLAFFYFLSTASKIHPSWTHGEYFTSLSTGLPFFPAGTERFGTNLLMAMEMVGAFALLSRKVPFQRAALAFFVFFHIYSGFIVAYRYPATVLPALLILFGPFYKWSPPPIGRATVAGWSLVGMLTALQLIGPLIPGDEKLTLEGNFYGLYMFEANHQCTGQITRGSSIVRRINSSNARHRCDPYEYWFQAKNGVCKAVGGPVAMVFNHSVNGRQFRTIVDERDICSLEYRPFSRNAWIKDERTAPVGHTPGKSIFR
jgi:hypothetical protein